jgi:hypothetical protein
MGSVTDVGSVSPVVSVNWWKSVKASSPAEKISN